MDFMQKREFVDMDLSRVDYKWFGIELLLNSEVWQQTERNNKYYVIKAVGSLPKVTN